MFHGISPGVYLQYRMRTRKKEEPGGDDNSQEGSLPYISLPRNAEELRLQIQSPLSHPATKMAFNAIMAHRSPAQAFILLLGISGSGKSSTMNYLFGKDLATVNDYTAGQHATEEYFVTMRSKEWKIKDLRLSFIDTPGFCDDGGLKQDAKNITTINHFIRNHEQLRDMFPNLVFLVINSTDNRIEGSRSRFAKLLHGIKGLGVIDKKNPNLVIVLTHVAMLPMEKSEWIQKVEDVKQRILSLVAGHLGIRPSIVVQENCPEKYRLEKNGEWYILPNGQRQPMELFLVCKTILNNANDEIGHEAIAICFRPGEETPEKGFKISESDIEKSEVDQLYKSLRDYTIKEPNTRICNMLDDYKMENNTRDVGNAVLILKHRLTDLNIKKPKDIQGMSINKLKATVYPVEISMQMEIIVREIFGLQYEESSGTVCPIGKGFNIFNDAELQKCPVELTQNYAPHGYPGNTSFSECNSLNVRCDSVRDHNGYKKQRLMELGFAGDISARLRFCEMKLRGGYNLEDNNKTSSEHNFQEISFLIEHAINEVDLKDPYIPTEMFKKDVCALPLTYDELDKDNLMKWMTFIEKWGSHFIVGVKLGGSIHGKALTSTRQNLEKQELCSRVMGEISAKYKLLQLDTKANYDRESLCSSMKDDELVTSTSSLEWNGGDRSKFKLTLETLRSEELEEWEKSLRYKPAPLWSSLKLFPITDLVKQVDNDKSLELQKASEIQNDMKMFEQATRETLGVSNKSTACFPSTASVTLVDGCKRKLEDVHVGENVLSSDLFGNTIVDKVIAWIHKVENTECKFLKIVHQFGTLNISEEHIFFVGKDKSACHAKEVKLGDTLHFYKQNKRVDVFVQSTVYSIEEVNGHGVYAPLTLSGNLIIDGVFVSCYCSVKNIGVRSRPIVSCHSLAHFAFLPLRVAYRLNIEINKMKYTEEPGIHKYAEWLMKIAKTTGMISEKPEE